MQPNVKIFDFGGSVPESVLKKFVSGMDDES